MTRRVYKMVLKFTKNELDEHIIRNGREPSEELRACVFEYIRGSLLMMRADMDVDWDRMDEELKET